MISLYIYIIFMAQLNDFIDKENVNVLWEILVEKELFFQTIQKRSEKFLKVIWLIFIIVKDPERVLSLKWIKSILRQ